MLTAVLIKIKIEKSQVNMADDSFKMVIDDAPSISGLYELAIGATAKDESFLIRYWEQFGFTVGKSGAQLLL